MALLAVISTESNYSFSPSNGDGVFSGPCPFCESGENRFTIFTAQTKPRYHCRTCAAAGDAIQFLRDYSDLSYVDAIKRIEDAPADFFSIGAVNPKNKKRSAATRSCSDFDSDKWQSALAGFSEYCESVLFTDVGASALEWLLESRGLTIDTIRHYRLGYNATDIYRERELFGLPEKFQNSGQPLDLKIPRGVTIPNYAAGRLRGLRVRRPKSDQKYWIVDASHNELFGTDDLIGDSVFVLCESEFDCMSIWQSFGHVVSPLATGGTTKARGNASLELLSQSHCVQIAFDADGSGDTAAQWWIDQLGNAERLRPIAHDVNEMLSSGDNLKFWIMGREVTA